MSNVFNYLKPQAKLPRNGFDLSQRHVFSCVAGRLYPILALDCVPGDHHEINVLELARTLPVHTDAFVRMKQHFEFYFVPYSQIVSNFNEFISQRNDHYSTAIDKNISNIPCTSIKDILSFVQYCNDLDLYDIHGLRIPEQSLQLLDLLGYGAHYRYYYDANYRECYRAYKVNVFRLATYQKIWYDYYRNAYYDNNFEFDGMEGDYNLAFNFDDCISTGDIGEVRNDPAKYGQLFLPRYRQWKKDLFTGLLPDAQFGSVTYVDMAGYHEAEWQDSQSVNGVNIDVYAILKANALQKWRENAMRAGSRTDDAFKAHYGVSPRFDNDKRAQFVGAFDSFIGLDEVVATDSGSNLGEIGAKGAGTASGKITFDCSDFGTLMCIYSVLPAAEYDAIGLDKQNTLFDHFDFFTPEFENLGFEPVQMHQLNVYTTPSQGVPGALNLLNVIGYAPRYWNYKTAIDKVHDNFLSMLGPADESVSPSPSPTKPSMMNHWVSTRRDYSVQSVGIDGSRQITISSLYVNPAVLDSVFVTSLNPDNAVITPQFIINCNFDIKSVRNMSVLGLPQF